MKIVIIFFHFSIYILFNKIDGQIKYIIDDFEGYLNGPVNHSGNGLFKSNDCEIEILEHKIQHKNHLGKRFIRCENRNKKQKTFLGKGIGIRVNLNENEDYLNFYLKTESQTEIDSIQIILQEDDNEDGKFTLNKDDEWSYKLNIHKNNDWNLYSLPIKQLKDINEGGDGIFNASYRNGKVICLIFSFINSSLENLDLDFIFFSKGQLDVNNKRLTLNSDSNFCCVGAWSKSNKSNHFTDIANNFEKNFDDLGSKHKIGIVHYFQPLNTEDTIEKYNYFSTEKLNEIIYNDYLPMITLENRIQKNNHYNEYNLENIINGKFDSYMIEFAKKIKKCDGMILLRILHEFNGDWYPWCISKNNNNPDLYIKSYRHIRELFMQMEVKNVKFIWCPNSMSIPQEPWNDIQLAYPGNDYVDYIGLDIYNGAGKSTFWKTFISEGIENYFVATQNYPDKPIIICETASIERNNSEKDKGKSKAEWIEQMAISLKHEMQKVRILCWFNESDNFKINSTRETTKAFYKYILSDEYFNSGMDNLYKVLRK